VIFTYTAEPGTGEEDALRRLERWAGTLDLDAAERA
jgi:hypothetical protein